MCTRVHVEIVANKSMHADAFRSRRLASVADAFSLWERTGHRQPEHSIYSFLAGERDRLFPDEAFADLFDEKKGRRSVPPLMMATVTVLHRMEGLSDREAVERYCFDARWRYAAGLGGYDGSGWAVFAHTVLVDVRERLRNSVDPDRIFTAALGAAREAGLVGKKRALDSTPLCDAVATMDTITLIRSAIRGLMKVADADLEDDTVTCPAGVTVSLRRHSDGGGIAKFAGACASCALAPQCTNAKEGRSIAVGPNEAVLARMRGPVRVAADCTLLAAAVNLARLGTLYEPDGAWQGRESHRMVTQTGRLLSPDATRTRVELGPVISRRVTSPRGTRQIP